MTQRPQQTYFPTKNSSESFQLDNGMTDADGKAEEEEVQDDDRRNKANEWVYPDPFLQPYGDYVRRLTLCMATATKKSSSLKPDAAQRLLRIAQELYHHDIMPLHTRIRS